jgi:hypothetical protein
MSILPSFLEFMREGGECPIEGRWVSDFDEFEALIGEELAKLPAETRPALEARIQEYVWLYEGEPALGECDESSFFYHDSIVFHDRKHYLHVVWREGAFSCVADVAGNEKVRRALKWRLEHWAVKRAVPAVMRLIDRVVESV